MPKEACNLNDCFLCRNCIEDWKELVAVKKQTFSIKKGKVLFNEGDKMEGIYFMYSGLLKVHMHWLEQKELIIRFARPGDIVGLRGIGESNTYPISATAISDVKICFIDNHFLETTLKTNPGFTLELMHYYAVELQKTEKRMRNLVHMDVKSRLAEALIDLSHLFSHKENNEITVNRQDIASYAGTTYETVFKFFTELLNQKIIAASGKTIRILKPENLKSLITSRK
jgi:cAMP-binding proteins - catabolite gene activator and regulatory subunit of cAMP-dependent protein kinases